MSGSDSTEEWQGLEAWVIRRGVSILALWWGGITALSVSVGARWHAGAWGLLAGMLGSVGLLAWAKKKTGSMLVRRSGKDILDLPAALLHEGSGAKEIHRQLSQRYGHETADLARVYAEGSGGSVHDLVEMAQLTAAKAGGA